MNKLLSIVLSCLLVFSVFTPQVYAAAVKSSPKKGAKKDKSGKSKNLDRIEGKEGALNESKAAMISVDALALQNYSESNNNFDFTNYPKITLKSAILETLSNSNVLKTAQEKVIQVKLQLKNAYSGYLPSIDFQYTYKNTNNIETGNPGIDKISHLQYNDENYKLSLRQSLYTGGSTSYKIKTLKGKVIEANRKFQIVIEQDIQKAIKAYLGVLFNYKNVKVNEKNMLQLNKILAITQVKYDSGALSIGDLSSIKANIANASSKLIKIKSALADAVDFYQYTLGEDFAKTAPFQDNFKIELGSLEDVYKEIFENNIALLNYRGSIESTKYKLLGIKSSFKPKVDFELTYKNVLNKEEFETNEESYYAKVTLAYNIYNGGKDTTKALQTYSSLKELKHRYNEEVRKIKWSTQKLYNSIQSLDKTLSSTEEEVEASIDMVDAYWEGFQLGEQDLNVLLQGQRQLNGAQLDLLKYKQDYLTNLFKLIKNEGKLSSYFEINKDNPDFLDFTATKSIDPGINLNSSNSKNATTNNQEIVKKEKFDLNTTVDEYLEVTTEPTFDDIVNFKDNFLESDDENFTIVISEFTNNYDAYTYIKLNRMLENAFSYGYFDKEGELISKKNKTKMIDVRTNIAHGIYSSKEKAQDQIDNILKNDANKEFKIVKTKEIKSMYNRYIDGLETQVDPFIIKPKKKKVFRTNKQFKDNFMNAPEDYLTINVVSFSKIKHAQNLIKMENIEKDSLVFKYGRKGEWIKVMYGIYPTYEDALKALSKHPKMVSKYEPIIERISHKQKLFKKYKQYNKEPKKAPVLDKKMINKDASKIKSIQVSEEIKDDFNIDSYATFADALKEAPKKFYTVTLDILPEEKILPFIEKYLTEDTYATIKTKNSGIQVIQGIHKKRDLAINAKNNLHPKLIDKAYLNTIKRLDLNNIIELKDIKAAIVEQNNVSIAKPIIDTNTSEKLNITDTNETKDIIEIQNNTPLSTVTNNNSLSFVEEFKSAPESYYTVTLNISPKQKAIKFINKYVKTNDYVTIKTKKDNIQILKGLYENRTQALSSMNSLKPWIKKEAYLSSLKKLNKNNIIELNNQEVPTMETLEENDNTKIELTNEVEEKDKTNFNKNNYRSFEDAIKNAPKSYFTLTLSIVQEKDAQEFITNYIFDDEYATIRTNEGNIQIIQGIYEDRLFANDSITDLHPSIINKAYLSKIQNVSLKDIVILGETVTIKKVPLETPKLTQDKPVIEEDYNNFIDQLSNAPKTYYTVTLKVLSEAASNKFIKEHITGTNFAKIKTKKGNIRVVQGLYENRAQAKNAILNLKSSLKKYAYLNSIKKLFPKNNQLIVKDEVNNEVNDKQYEYSDVNNEFVNKIKNAPSNQFTIVLSTIDKNKVDSFVSTYILDKNNYAVRNINNSSTILVGIYENSILANEAKQNLHPKMTNKSKIVSIQSIR